MRTNTKMRERVSERLLVLLMIVLINLFVFASCTASKEKVCVAELNEQAEALRAELKHAEAEGNDVLIEYLKEEIADLKKQVDSVLAQSSADGSEKSYEKTRIASEVISR